MMAGAAESSLVSAHLPGVEREDDEERSRHGSSTLEDTGELRTPDARSAIGQGLASRTWSRPIRRACASLFADDEEVGADPAVATPRPGGRDVEFTPFRGRGARGRAHGPPTQRVAEQTTLASLYAILEGIEPGPRDAAAGLPVRLAPASGDRFAVDAPPARDSSSARRRDRAHAVVVIDDALLEVAGGTRMIADDG